MYSKLSSLLMTPVMASCQRLSKLESLLYISEPWIQANSLRYRDVSLFACFENLFIQIKNAVMSGVLI